MHKSNFRDKMWKVDREKDSVYIILKIAQFGTQNDYFELKKRYTDIKIKKVVQEHYYNLDDLTRNFFNIKYKLDLPLKKTLNEITSGYSLRFKEKIFIG
jgi:hypothetical protein